MIGPRETTIDVRPVYGRAVEVVRLDWPNGAVRYDLYLATLHRLERLTVEDSLDRIPDDEEIVAWATGEPIED